MDGVYSLVCLSWQENMHESKLLEIEVKKCIFKKHTELSQSILIMFTYNKHLWVIINSGIQ